MKIKRKLFIIYKKLFTKFQKIKILEKLLLIKNKTQMINQLILFKKIT